MIEKIEGSEGIFFLVVYALAAIAGGLGGCVVWSYYTQKSKRAAAFVFAYAIIGLVFGLVAGSVMLMMKTWTLPEVILYSLATGFGGTMAVFGLNWGAGMAFRWRNFEVKFTVRKPFHDRRSQSEEE